MNKYQLTALSVAAIVGVSAGTVAALNTQRPAAAPPSAAPSDTSAPESSDATATPSLTGSSEPTADAPSSSTDSGAGDSEGSDSEGSDDTIEPRQADDSGGTGSVEGEYLSLEIADLELLGSGDPVAQPMLVTAFVCVTQVPSGDSDGLVDVGYNDFAVEQTGTDARSGPPWADIDWEIVSDDEAFPEIASVGQGECVSGVLPFLVGLDVDSTVLTFSNDYSDGASLTIA